ncbi:MULTISPECIES: hypothetical protein [Burkholderia cepacia complex]|uniref:hypothetical protein n=1 Tax=Burkholderia cepacia complex TaxID=87882 RepID=UPI0012BAD7CA|nr:MULTISPECIES: hypothetical protein [Burkholderia cepacia complex]
MQDTLNCMRIRAAPAMRTGRIGVCRMMPRVRADGYSSFPAHYAGYYKYILKNRLTTDRQIPRARLNNSRFSPARAFAIADPRIFPYQTFPNFADISCN